MKPAKHNGAAIDALDLLKRDHDRVKALFREFDALKGKEGAGRRKGELVDDICYALTLHNALEEELFYPALRAAIGADDEELLDEADIEHAGARELIGQLEIMVPGDDHYDATVTVLGEEVAHHIDKEESELFDVARQAGVALDALGRQLAARQEELEDDPSSPPSTLDAMQAREGMRRQPRAPN